MPSMYETSTGRNCVRDPPLLTVFANCPANRSKERGYWEIKPYRRDVLTCAEKSYTYGAKIVVFSLS